MTTNMRTAWNTAKLAQGLPTAGAGATAGDPVSVRGIHGVNIWGTLATSVPSIWTGLSGRGVGLPANGTYGMVAIDGVFVNLVNVTAAIVENSPIYITAGNLLTDSATGNTLYGYADEPSAINATARIGVAISAQMGA
jgi:hypothetical protein